MCRGARGLLFTMLQGLFGGGATGVLRSKQPQEQLREWQSTLRSEQRKLDRQIRGAREASRARPYGESISVTGGQSALRRERSEIMDYR